VFADHKGEAAGYHLETPEYAACRRAANADAAMGYYQRPNELIMQQMNRRQTCMYSGNTVGGVTSGTVNCLLTPS
jgi:hypothetical protein